MIGKNKRKFSKSRLKLLRIFALFKRCRPKKSRRPFKSRFQKVKYRCSFSLTSRVRQRRRINFGAVSRVLLRRLKTNSRLKWRLCLTKSTGLSIPRNRSCPNSRPNYSRKQKLSRHGFNSNSREAIWMRRMMRNSN